MLFLSEPGDILERLRKLLGVRKLSFVGLVLGHKGELVVGLPAEHPCLGALEIALLHWQLFVD